MQEKNHTLIRLYEHLREEQIEFYRTGSEFLKNRAVVEFRFDLRSVPFILIGDFADTERELVCVAHEAGHILVFREMDRNLARDYLCAIFALQYIGLGKISDSGQELVLNVEAQASTRGFSILQHIGINREESVEVANIFSVWYRSYESLCKREPVNKIRKKIYSIPEMAFLLSELKSL